MTTKPEIKIGDKFFMFDENRRVYERDANGRAVGGPTFRGHFYEVTIEGDTSRSWTVKWPNIKIPKSDPFSVLYTEEMISEREWVAAHRYSIARKLEITKDADILRKVADLIGYGAEGRS